MPGARRWLLVLGLVGTAALAACSGSGATPSASTTANGPSAGSSAAAPATPAVSGSSSMSAPPITRITDAATLSAGDGALAKQIIRAAQQCTKPTYGICRDDQAAIKVTVTREICQRFGSTVPAVATALGVDMRNQHIRGGVTPTTDDELLTSQPWTLTEARCQWFGTPEGLPTVTMNIGLVWRTPPSDACAAFPAKSCTALTTDVLQIDDSKQTQFFYQVEAASGAARFGVSTYQQPALTPAQIARAAAAVRKVAAQIKALDP